jgi:hypothetical protein
MIDGLLHLVTSTLYRHVPLLLVRVTIDIKYFLSALTLCVNRTPDDPLLSYVILTEFVSTFWRCLNRHTVPPVIDYTSLVRAIRLR